MAELTFGGSLEESALPPPEGGGGSDDSPSPAPRKRGRPKGSTNSSSLVTLEKRLTEKLLEEMVVPVAFVSPLAAANIERRAERTAKAAVRLAAKNPKVKKGLEKIIDGSDVFTVAMFPISTAICVMVDWGMMPPLAPPSRAMGVPQIWDDAHPEYPLSQVYQDAQTSAVESHAGNNGDGNYRRGLDAEVMEEPGDGWTIVE